MNYQDWYEANEEELSIEFAESGADRELDSDFERFCEDKFSKTGLDNYDETY